MIDKEIFCDDSFKASEPGSRYKEKFHGVVNDDGIITLVSDGFEDIQEIIESWEPETDIYNIISRVQNGDVDLLNQRQGFYGDVVNMPKTYAEMLQLMIDVRAEFDKLPIDIKEKFGNDFNQYMAKAGTEEFFKKLGYEFKKDDDSMRKAELDPEQSESK